MGERAKIIVNEYTALDIMKRPDFDINKFYGSDIRLFIKVAINEIKKIDDVRKKYNECYQDKINLNNIINELEKYINETKIKEFEKGYGRRYGKTFTQAEVIICNMIINKLQELKGDSSRG